MNFNKDLFKSWTPSCRRTNRGRDVEMRRTPPLGVQTLETVEKGGGGLLVLLVLLVLSEKTTGGSFFDGVLTFDSIRLAYGRGACVWLASY